MRINLEKYSLKTMVKVGERQGEGIKIKNIQKQLTLKLIGAIL